MATQQEVIKAFMKALDTHTLTKKSNETDVAFTTRIINAAIKACSKFSGVQAVIDQMLADCKNANNATTFLKNYCGIDLSNNDTGAITGSDTGGTTTKTAQSIVPETLAVADWTIPKSGSSTTIIGLKVNWPTAGVNGKTFTAAEKHVLKGLNSEWIKQTLKLAKDSYGIDFNTSGATVKTLNVKFENSSINDRNAAIQSTDSDGDGKTDALTLIVNMYYYGDIDTTSKDGAIKSSSRYSYSTWLDRVLAHEFIHAIMATNVNYYRYLPSFVKEGLAELVHGIDDDNPSGITKLAGQADALKTALSLADYSRIKIDNISNPSYAAGYMFMRYLAKQTLMQGENISNKTPNKTITGTSLNDTINNLSGGKNVTIVGGAGNDSVRNNANARIDAGTGADTITNTDLGGKATLLGGAGNDYITTYNADNVSISGGADNDKIELRGTGKNITVSGGGGNDAISISGGTALIQYSAGDGNDSVVGFNVNSTLQIGGGTGTYSTTNSGSNIVVTAGTGKVTLMGAANLSKLNIAGKKVSQNERKNITNTKSETLITGSANADTLYNSGSKVTIDALGGNDSISNRSSGASINGGAGNDTIYNDSIYGDGSRVTIIGGTGKDSISNYAGNVIIYGNADSDEIYNGTGGNSVTIDGGDSSDEIDSRGTNVSIKGGAGNDSIYIDGSKATVNGGTGKDSIRNFGENTLFQYKAGDGNDSIWGFKTNSTLQIEGVSDVSLQTGGSSNVIATVGKGKVTLVNAANLSVVNIQGSGGSDTIKSTVSGAKIDALGGNDKIYNYASSKVTILGGNGDDTITNWGAAASMNGGAGNDLIWGDSGKDTLSGGSNNDKLHGEEGNDKLYGGTGNDTLWGGSGNDSLWGNAGSDTFIYAQGEGKDVIFGFENADLLQITGTFSASYSKAKKEIYFDVGTTTNAITLKDFGSTSTFNVNGTNYKISGTKLVKK